MKNPDRDDHGAEGRALMDAAWRGRSAAMLVLLALGVVFILALLGIWRLTQAEVTRETVFWQRQLTLVADAQARAIEDWHQAHMNAVTSLAANPSIQLYLSEHAQAQSITAEAAQRGYLENLLKVMAERSGFADKESSAPPSANLNAAAKAGIALLDADGKNLIASNGPLPRPSLFLTGARQGAVSSATLMGDGDGRGMMRYAAPVLALQAETNDNIVGYVYAARPITDGLAGLIDPPAFAARSIESHVLVAGINDEVVDLVKNNSAPIDRLARWALQAGAGSVEIVDDLGREYLIAVRPVGDTGWVVTSRVERAEALDAVESERGWRIAGLSLVLMAITAFVLLLWRHGVSVQVARHAAQSQWHAARAERLAQFLKMVSDGQPTAILALDAQDQVVFANNTAAMLAGSTADELPGKTLPALLGPAAAGPLQRLMAVARTRGERATAALELPLAKGQRQGRAEAALLAQGARNNDAEMLLVWDDLSELLNAHHRREQGLEDLIALLAGLVDARDPHSAEQSRRVAKLATAVARERGWSDVECRTVRIAGMLMNLGKLLVPRELLTKPGLLSEPELDTVRHAMRRVAELLAPVEFDAPVAETLAALPMAGESCQSAPKETRLLCIINDFVGMVSARAHRSGLDIDQAVGELRADRQRYEPKSVSALAHVIDNRGWRERIAQWKELTA